jgi:hypothetical protein
VGRQVVDPRPGRDLGDRGDEPVWQVRETSVQALLEPVGPGAHQQRQPVPFLALDGAEALRCSATQCALRTATRISTLKARIHAGNSNSTQAEMPTPTSSTSAAASPATVSHLDTISVRRAMVTVVSVNTAAIRIA